jgi:hypothetical protein
MCVYSESTCTACTRWWRWSPRTARSSRPAGPRARSLSRARRCHVRRDGLSRRRSGGQSVTVTSTAGPMSSPRSTSPPPYEPAVRGAAAIPGLVHFSRHMLAGVDSLTAVPSAFNLLPHAVYAGKKLWLGVECRHHHMPPLPPRRIIAVMTHDETLYAVVFGVNSCHRPRVASSFGINHPQNRRGTWHPRSEATANGPIPPRRPLRSSAAQLRPSLRPVRALTCCQVVAPGWRKGTDLPVRRLANVRPPFSQRGVGARWATTSLARRWLRNPRLRSSTDTSA